MEHNYGLIDNIALEEACPADYYAECCAFLNDFIGNRPALATAEIREALTSLIEILETDPAQRNFDSVETLQQLVRPFLYDERSASNPAAAVTAALLLFGMAGKALYFLSKQPQQNQFEREVGHGSGMGGLITAAVLKGF